MFVAAGCFACVELRWAAQGLATILCTRTGLASLKTNNVGVEPNSFACKAERIVGSVKNYGPADNDGEMNTS